MKYFIDTEFVEKPGSIELISIGIVCEDGREYYAISKDFNLKKAWNRYDMKDGPGGKYKEYWIRDNVLNQVHNDLSAMCSVYHKTYRWKSFEAFTQKSLKTLISWFGKSNDQIAKEIIEFIDKKHFKQPRKPSDKFQSRKMAAIAREKWLESIKPQFYAYFADYDWVVFCWLFGRMIDLPAGFPKYCIDIKQMMAERWLDSKWKDKYCPQGRGTHSAIEDARWNEKLYNTIKTNYLKFAENRAEFKDIEII